MDAVTIGPIPNWRIVPDAPAMMVLYCANISREPDWSSPQIYTLDITKYRIRMTATHMILVLKCTCPSGRLTAGSLSPIGFTLYNRLGFASSI